MWLPDVIWRLDQRWKALREEVPWVKKRPSEYLVDHVRLSTQPFMESPRKGDVEAMFHLLDGERMLLYASGNLRQSLERG